MKEHSQIKYMVITLNAVKHVCDLNAGILHCKTHFAIIETLQSYE